MAETELHEGLRLHVSLYTVEKELAQDSSKLFVDEVLHWREEIKQVEVGKDVQKPMRLPCSTSTRLFNVYTDEILQMYMFAITKCVSFKNFNILTS